MTMTFSDQAALARQDGQVTDDPAGGKPARPKRRTFTAAYKARILAAYDALPEGSAERGGLLRKERLYHSHIEHWREQAAKGTPASVHDGSAVALRARRAEVLEDAYRAHPQRFRRRPVPPKLPEKAWINPPTPTTPPDASSSQVEQAA